MKRSLGMAAALAVFVAAGCNQIFGLDPAHLPPDGAAGSGGNGAHADASSNDERVDAPLEASSDGTTAIPDAPVDQITDMPAAMDSAIDRPADMAADQAPRSGCKGMAGPTPINIDNMFCVDSTPVTNDQYAAFLDATKNSPVPQPVGCQWNTLFTPSSFPYSATAGSLPVVNVDFCDAWSYCQWAGKRLCGVVDKSGSSITNFDRVRDGELYYACSGGANHQLTYSYGGDGGADPTVCDTVVCNGNSIMKVGRIDPVASNPLCQSIVYRGLYDLNSQLEVWLDMCLPGSALDGSGDDCRLSTPLSCDTSCGVPNNSDGRANSADDIGIRCCSDLD